VPVALFAFGLLLAALVLVVVAMIQYTPQRKGPEFGVLAVALVAYLDAISVMTVSIGWVLSVMNVVLGLFLTALTTHYRRQILFATLVSFLLALFLQRDFFPPAPNILRTLLAITAVGAAVQVVRGWWRKEKGALGSAGIVMVACLAGLALLISSYPLPLTIGLFLFTAGMSALIGILSTQYRLSFFIVGTFSLLWAITLSQPSEQSGSGVAKAQRPPPIHRSLEDRN
jgi:hypothetical protein